MPSGDGVASRRAALTMLDAVLRTGRTLESAAQGVRGLSGPDQGLAVAISGEVLRRLPDLDLLIDSATRQRMPDDSKARMVLRMALAQKIGLQTPDHAIVATALPLVDGGPRRLVHGVLGTLLRRGVEPSEAPHLPADVEQRWSEAWGDDVVEAARREIAQRPPLDLSFASAEAASDYAAANGGVSLAPNHVRLGTSGAVPSLAGFGAGWRKPGSSDDEPFSPWWVQDLAASIPARLIPGDAGQVLDLCSAPGGKAMQMAAAGHGVVAVDSSQSRLERLSQNLERTGLKAELVCVDALQWSARRTFDAVLLDAPCSATGTFRRHPEVLYRARPAIIRDSAELQARLLDRAAQWVNPGGSLVYSVCSLEPAEGEAVVGGFLAAHPGFKVVPGDLPDFAVPTAEGYVRILPGLLGDEGGLDGFFAARLVRDRA